MENRPLHLANLKVEWKKGITRGSFTNQANPRCTQPSAPFVFNYLRISLIPDTLAPARPVSH